MKRNREIRAVEDGQLKSDLPIFAVGDTIEIHTRIIEGEKERIQILTGTVIARKGSGLSETFSIYRVSYGSAVEKVMMLHSPKIAKIEVIKKGKVRKGKLFYLRGKSGKKAKIEEKIQGVIKKASSNPKATPAEQASS